MVLSATGCALADAWKASMGFAADLVETDICSSADGQKAKASLSGPVGQNSNCGFSFSMLIFFLIFFLLKFIAPHKLRPIEQVSGDLR